MKAKTGNWSLWLKIKSEKCLLSPCTFTLAWRLKRETMSTNRGNRIRPLGCAQKSTQGDQLQHSSYAKPESLPCNKILYDILTLTNSRYLTFLNTMKYWVSLLMWSNMSIILLRV
jgi:hypothetical protein